MKLVVLESPFAGAGPRPLSVIRRWRNIRYARRCVRDSLSRGEAPTASHLLYTQPGILGDDVPAERKLGIDAGLSWRYAAEASVVYFDRGISIGMQYGIEAARAAGRLIEIRRIEAAGNRDADTVSARPAAQIPPAPNLEVTVETIAAMLRGSARWLISIGMAGAIVLQALSIVLSARREIPRIVEQQGTEALKLPIPEQTNLPSLASDGRRQGAGGRLLPGWGQGRPGDFRILPVRPYQAGIRGVGFGVHPFRAFHGKLSRVSCP